MNKWLSTIITAIGLIGFASLCVNAEETDPAYFFPPKMQSFPLYGDAAIPNSKPTVDEETGADKGWIQKVSRPYIQVMTPAKKSWRYVTDLVDERDYPDLIQTLREKGFTVETPGLHHILNKHENL